MTAWVLSLLWLLVPRAAWTGDYPEVAAAIVAESTRAPLFEGPRGVEQTVALVTSVAWYESHFDPRAVGDHSASSCLLQIHKSNYRTLGVTRRDLANPAVCVRAWLAFVHRTPPGLSIEDRLAHGLMTATQARHRVQFAKRLLREHPVPNGGDS